MKIKYTDNSLINSLLIFSLWPLLGVFVALKKIKSQQAFYLLWLYCGFVGLTFTFYESGDGARYAEEFHIHGQNLKLGILDFLNNTLFDAEFGRIDFFQPLFSYIVSRFTVNEHILYLLFGLFTGYFYSKNIVYLIGFSNGKIRSEALGFFLVFCFQMPFWTAINGFRFWTATYIIIYGILNYYLLNNRLKGIIFVLFTVFIHDSFVIAVFVFLVHLLLRFKHNILFPFYISSFFLSKIELGFLRELMESLPLNTNKRKGYINEEYVEYVQNLELDLNWYVKYQFLFMEWFILALIIYNYFLNKDLVYKMKNLYGIYAFGLLMLTVTNLLNHIPSISRFYNVGYLPLLAFIYIYFQNFLEHRQPEWFRIITLAIVVYTLFFSLWTGTMYWSVASFLGNPFTFFLFDSTISIYELIKSI